MKEYNYKNLFNFEQGYFVAGLHPNERFGQAFFNEFGIKPCGIDIFHETDNEKACSLVWQGLTEYENKNNLCSFKNFNK